MKTLRIQTRLLALAGAGALMACLIGGVGYHGLDQAIHDSGLLEDSAVAVRASMTADMKHDNIRAEVFRMAIAAAGQDAAQMAAVQQAVAGEVKTLQSSLESAAQRAPTSAAQAAVRQALTPAMHYGDVALRAVATMKARPQDSAAALAEFDTAFDALEVALEQSGDAMERASEQLASGAHAASSQAKHLMLAVFVGGLAALLVFSGWVVRSVLTPLRATRNALDQLNQGDGDLSRRLPVAAAEFGEMSERFNAFLGKIAGVVGEVQGAAQEVSVASQQIAQGNQDLSHRTEHSAGSLQQAVAQVARIDTLVQQGADAARQASGLASHASTVAARGGAAVHRVVSTMDEINLASRRIGDIIGVIDGIAFQTNILALNAAVEAARAGEQGRGFAVVASEVRTLAGRSAEAAREIKVLIGTSVAKVDAGGQYVRDAGTTMDEIVDSVDRVRAIIEAITGSAEAQRAGIEQVNRTVVEIDQNTQQNAALVEQTAAAAQQVAQQTRVLCDTVGVFRTSAELV